VTNENDSITEGDAKQMKRALTLTEIGVIFSLLSSAAVGVFSLGVVYAEVRTATARLDKIEPKVDETEDSIQRIDANVQFLIDLAREERSRR